jgi:pyrimidine deaminase RibD-like protein
MTTAPSPGTGRLALTDDVLAEAWDTALQLAWEGLTAQTTPVGAVVVTEAGEVVAAGRGRGDYQRAAAIAEGAPRDR